METRQKASSGVGVLSLAQGFASLAVAYADPNPNESLAWWLLVGALVCLALALGLWFWPSKQADPAPSAIQSGSDNQQQVISGRDAIAQQGESNIVVQAGGTYYEAREHREGGDGL